MTVARAGNGFWATNHLVNPIIRLVLRSPLGTRLGRHLAILSYRGRRTGQRHELVVQYVRDGTRAWIVPGQPGRKTWWLNFSTPARVEVRLSGQEFHGDAIAISGADQPDEVRIGLALYLSQLPRMAKALGLRLALDETTTIPATESLSGVVMVRVDLNPVPPLM